MGEVLHDALGALLLGAGATAFMDLMTAAREKWFGTPSADYALVGRWFAHLARGRFRHDSIKAAAAVRHERLLGWAAHYAVGVAFASILLAAWGFDWMCHPTIGPALTVGIGSVAAPLLIMQPGMGAGIAARRTPKPRAARIRSLVTHALFGIGLYVAGLVLSLSNILRCSP